MNFIDLLAVLGLGAGYLRGRKRGLDAELYRLILICIAFIAGCGLFKLVAKALSILPGLDAENSGVFGFIIVMVATLVILRKLKGSLRAALKARFGGEQHRKLAGWVGLARWGVGVIVALTAIVLSDAELLASPVTDGSLVGRVIATLLGRN